MGALRALAMTDLRKVNRDTLTKFMLVYPFLLGLLMRFLVPVVVEGTAQLYDLRPHILLIVGLFGLIMGPVLIGTTIGLLVLDERDDRTLAALQVTPLTMNRYLGYRLTGPVLVSLLSVFISMPLMNLVWLSPWQLLPIAIIAALTAPLFTLIEASFAHNKVQGLAVMKATGLFIVAPAAAWFVPEPWQWLFGVAPTFWPVKSFWTMLEGGAYWWPMLVGFCVYFAWLAPLLHRFNRVIYE
jgi:fluoroquinolone transport system permease protein